MKQRSKILIIEDNQDLNEMFQIAFDEKKYEIKAVTNGVEGLTEFVEFKPDLILLDIMMPQMDGYEVLRAIKENTSLSPLVVVNSNLEQKKDEQRAFDTGADYYLRKSEYTPSQLVQKIQDILEGRAK